MPSQEILDQMNITTPEGEDMVSTIVENARTIAQHNADTAESVSNDI